MNLEEASNTASEFLTRAAKELSTPLATPVYSGVSLKNVQGDADKVKQSASEAKDTGDVEKARYNQSNASEKAGYDAEAQAKANEATATQARSQLIADQNKLINSWYGIDADNSAPIAISAMNLQKEQTKAEAMLRSIQEQQGTNLLNDPLGYLSNLLTLPSEIDQYNRQVDIVNNIDATIKTGIQNSNNTSLRVNAGVPTITASMAKAKADEVLAEATIKKAQADKNLSIINMDFASKRLASDIAVFSATRESTAMQIQEAQKKYESAINAVRIAESRASRLEAAAKLYEQVAQNEGINVILKQYESTAGIPPGTMNRTVFMRMSKQDQEDIISVAAGKFGADPLDALMTAKRIHLGAGASDDLRSMMSYLNTKVTNITNAAVKEGKMPKDKKEQEEFIRGALNTSIKEDMADAANIASPFHELSPAKILMSTSIDPNSKLGQALKPLAEQPGQMRHDIVIATIEKNFPNPTDAGNAVAQYYKANMTERNKILPSGGLGIQLPKDYTVTLPGVFSNKGYDLTNAAQATQYVTAKRIKDLQAMQQGAMGIQPPTGGFQNRNP